MERKFCIISDGSCDLPDDIVKKREIDIVHFLVSFDGSQYKKEGVEIDLNEFYQRMIDDPKTYPMTAPPPLRLPKIFIRFLSAGQKKALIFFVSVFLPN